MVAADATITRLTASLARVVFAVAARLVFAAEDAHLGLRGARRLQPLLVQFRPQTFFLMPRIAPLCTACAAFAFPLRSLNPRGGRLHPLSERLHLGQRLVGDHWRG